MSDRYIPLAAALGAFGVRGEVKVRTFTAAPEGVCAYGPLYDPSGRLLLTPRRWRAIKDGLAISAPEIADREAAQALKGALLCVPRERLPAAAEEEYYHVDLIGCAVEDLSGRRLGAVTAVFDFGAGDLLEVRDAAGAALLIPFTRAQVPHVDVAARRIVAAPLAETDQSD